MKNNVDPIKQLKHLSKQKKNHFNEDELKGKDICAMIIAGLMVFMPIVLVIIGLLLVFIKLIF